jgi:hypothetical protein
VTEIEQSLGNFSSEIRAEYDDHCASISSGVKKIRWRRMRGLYRRSPRPVTVSADGQLFEADYTWADSWQTGKISLSLDQTQGTLSSDGGWPHRR